MLHEFLTANRDELVNRCRTKVSLRTAPTPNHAELEYGIPLFLDQLTRTLHSDWGLYRTQRVAGAPQDVAHYSDAVDIGASAGKHGSELLRMGFSVGQVVHDYGDLCQAVTELATETEASITTEEFNTLNRCLDNAIADAVSAYAAGVSIKANNSTNEKLGFLAHEMRNLLHTIVLSLNVMRKGTVGFSGATAAVLDRNLAGMGHLIDRSLAEVRLNANLPPLREIIALDTFIQQCEVIGALEAKIKSIRFTVEPVAPDIVINADPQMLAAAVSNLLQNAFKFTWPFGHVLLKTHATEDRVRILVEDQCGGLTPGREADLFRPFTQHGANRSGVGLGLTITRQTVEANGGHVSVKNVPEYGCVFTIELPRHRSPNSAGVDSTRSTV